MNPGVGSIGENQVSLVKDEPRTLESDLQLYLVGTPLESAFARLSQSVWRHWNVAWREIPAKTKSEARRAIRTLASAAVVLDQLPVELSKPLCDEFAKRLRRYIAKVLSTYSAHL